MDALIHAACPSCHVEGDVPVQYAGKVIRCRKCGQQFTVPQPKPVDNRPVQQHAVCAKGLDELDEVGLAPMSPEEIEHEERIKKKMIQQMKDSF